MKKIMFFFLLIFTGYVIGEVNLIKNGSFEEGWNEKKKVPLFWNKGGYPKYVGDLILDNKIFIDGKYSLKHTAREETMVVEIVKQWRLKKKDWWN